MRSLKNYANIYDRKDRMNSIANLKLSVRNIIVFILMLFTAIFVLPVAGVELAEFEYLSDTFNERGVYYNSYGELGWDATFKPFFGGVPRGLRIVDKTYEKGLGTQTNSEIVLNLDGLYNRFTAEVGIAYQGGKPYGTAIARVLVDGQVRFESELMNAGTPAVTVDVDLTGAKQLKLIGDDYNKDHWNDDVSWCDAKLFYDPKVIKEKNYLEVGAFAKVISCDPNMADGPEAKRTEPLSKDVLVMDKYLFADDKGNYEVPVWKDGRCCIGLRWFETRNIKKMAIEFANGSAVPDVKTAKVQWWVGDSPWQGGWKDLDGEIKTDGRVWSFVSNSKDVNDARNKGRETKSARMGEEKIRWIFDKTDEPIFVSGLSAWSHSLSGIAEVELSLERPLKGKVGKVSMYNGTIMKGFGKEVHGCEWKLDKPLKLKVRYKKHGFYLADKTSIRVEFDGKTVAVAVRDILENGPVYANQFGLFAASKGCETSLEDYKNEMAKKKTVLERVRQMEDQSFTQAWDHVHREIQDGSPMMISLACNNKKFVVTHEGQIWNSYKIGDGMVTVTPTFGSGNKDVSRNLYGNWLPVPVVSKTENGISYNQRTFVGPFDEKAPDGSPWWYRNNSICVSEITVENTDTVSKEATVKLKITADTKAKTGAELKRQGDFVLAFNKGGKALVVADGGGLVFLKSKLEGDTLEVSGVLPGHCKETFTVYMPSWDFKADDCETVVSKSDLLNKTETYWKKLIAGAMQIDIPEPMLLNIIRASQVHCFLAARENEFGNLISPWISSDRYGPLESESQAVIIGMDMMGQEEFARRSHNFFLKKYKPQGYMTTGYTLMGTGQHMMTLGRHYQLNQNDEWMKYAQPIMVNACEWIIAQIDKNKNLYSNGDKPYDYGLFPPGVYADWDRFAYHSYIDAFYYGGLKETTKALQRANDPRAAEMIKKTEQFRADFMRAYKWTQEKYHVLLQSDGSWEPGSPSMIGCFGLVGNVYKGEDWKRAWAKDGGKGLVMTFAGLIDAEKEKPEILRMANYMEDVVFLTGGMGQYSVKETQEDWFNIGGFGKCQPYYTRLCETYALIDDIKPFLRSYFNPIGSLVDKEILTFWEHFLRGGGWNKTHETGWFLEQTKIMLLTERGNDLWVGPFITTAWMKDGMVVGVRQATSNFGKVDYKITSHAKDGYIEAEVTPPTRNKPDSIVVRLRHPDEKKMKSVTVDGKEYKDFNADREIVTIKSWNGKIAVRANY